MDNKNIHNYSKITRRLTIFSLAVIFLVIFTRGCNVCHDTHVPAGLMVDLLSEPGDAVITNPIPWFSWIIEDSRQGARQTAWQIMVVSEPEYVHRNMPDIWDSGIVPSDRSVSVPYTGKPLEPEQTYWWKVRTWDQYGKMGVWSKAQQFNTGSFDGGNRKWPGESRWVGLEYEGNNRYVFENRHPVNYHDIKPVSIVKNEAGNHFISFEKAAFGTLRLKIDASDITGSLVIHLGEKSAPGNRVDTSPGGSISYKKVEFKPEPGSNDIIVELPRQYSQYPNSQVLAAHMPEVTAFRFAEIEGWPYDLNEGQVLQHALLYQFNDESSWFQSSDENLNMIWELCKHTLKVTPFMGLYIDGTRERMPYEADAWIQQISHYCVDREFAIQRYTNAFLIYNPSWPTEWHLHIVPMAWADYMATGDERFIERYYDELKQKTLLPLAREDGLISTRGNNVTGDFLESIHYTGSDFRDIVDWPQGIPADMDTFSVWFGSVRVEGETDRYVFGEINTVVNAFHYKNLVLMEKIAAVLGKSDDQTFFGDRAALVRSSINKKLLNNHSGLYTDGEGIDHSALHANMFPVALGLAPGENYGQLRQFITSKGMACSPYGAPYLLDALFRLDEYDHAVRLLTSDCDRSWMNMIRSGSTITTEAWDIKYKRNMTWNHAWGASPVYTITRRIFGIEPLEPAFRKILIRPRPGPLEWAEIKSPTIRGPVYAKFKNKSDGEFHLEIVIPANTTARVMLPCISEKDLKLVINGNEVPFTIEEGCVVADNIGAGRHIIDLKLQP